MDIRQRILCAKHTLFEKAYASLNDRQKEAVFQTEGPLLVLAGAGSGKTTVLVRRIAHIIRYGNAYHNDTLPDNMLFEPFAAKLEALASEDSPDKALLASALGLFSCEPAKPYQILAITFTNKAANEIKDRLASELGDTANDIWAGTFHSICAKLLRMHAERIGCPSSFTIYDTDDQKRLMTAIVKDLNVNDKSFAPKSVLNEISRAKEKLLDPPSYADTVGKHDVRRQTIVRLYTEYEARKTAAGAFDFDDLILMTVKLLEKDEEIRDRYQRKFRYVLVDEYQDTNMAQFKLTSLLTNEKQNIMVVGDDDQSIYKFRGATIENILGFDREFKDAKIIRLEQNYRSTSVIVDAANGVIKNNIGRKGKTLWTANEEGEKISVAECFHQGSEAQFVANTITDLVSGGAYRFEDFAILYRMNAQSMSFEETFARSGIPYRVIGGMRFYERKEIKDIIAYLCVLANPGDVLRLRRIIGVPKRGIGEATVDELERLARLESSDMLTVAKNAAMYPTLSRAASKLVSFAGMMEELRDGIDSLPLGVLVEKVLEKTGYMEMLRSLDAAESRDRCANVAELVTNATAYANNTPDGTLFSFLEEVALVADIDNYDRDANAVVMMTVHSAKGLEFPVVFLPGLEEGVFPGQQTIMANDEEMEEERRLAYVAITRARKKLYISHCRSRMIFGRTEYHEMSRFLREIPQELCQKEYCNMDMEYEKNEAQNTSDTAVRGEFTPTRGSFNYEGAAKNGSAYFNDDAKRQNMAKAAPKAEVFEVGNKVVHPVFGEGVVLGARPMSGDVLYEVAFDKVGTKKIMGNFAKMTKA